MAPEQASDMAECGLRDAQIGAPSESTCHNLSLRIAIARLTAFKHWISRNALMDSTSSMHRKKAMVLCKAKFLAEAKTGFSIV